MIILAAEMSTSACSIAISAGGGIVAEHGWEEHQIHHQLFFSAIPALLEKAAIRIEQVDTFALGLGPGSFSGLRCALSALNGMALPEKKRLFGLTSAEILAWQVMKETGLAPVTILGDARRGHIWYARHDRAGSMVRQNGPVSLVPVDRLHTILGDCAVAATPDWNRIGTTIRNAMPAGATLLQDRRVPLARTAAELALTKIENSLPSEPLLPVYLHPPVG